MLRRFSFAAIVLIGLLVPNPVPAQEKGGDELIWETKEGLQLAGAVQMVGNGDAVGSMGVRLAAVEQGLLWPAWKIDLDFVPPLNKDWLDRLKDKTAIPDLRAKSVQEIPVHDQAYYRIYNQAVYYSHLTPADVFQQAARDLSHVTFTHLWRDPDRYRGQVVPVEGKLLRLRREEATKPMQEVGIKHVYEGWVVGPTKFTSPYWIVFTSLPEGFKEGEDLNRPVKFYGYYIKKVQYTAGNAERVTHLLIGPTIYADPVPVVTKSDDEPFSKSVLVYTVLGLGGVGGLIALLSWFFRRGDRRVRAHLQAINEKRGLQLEPDEPPPLARPVEEPPPEKNGEH